MLKKVAVGTVGVVLLMGCGGSSSGNGDDVSRVITGANALNIGTQSNTTSTNGLQLANPVANTEALQAEGPFTVRLVSIIDDASGPTRVVISEEALTMSFDSFAELNTRANRDGTFTFNGETVEIVDGRGTLSGGQDFFFATSATDTHSMIVDAFANPTSGDEFIRYGNFAIGLQTTPDQLPDTGTSTYAGDIVGFAFDVDEQGDFSGGNNLVGDIILNVGFLDGSVGGLLNLETQGGGLREMDTTLALDPTTLDGTGFSTTANTFGTCEGLAVCTADVQIGGAFFGPNAEELTGTFGFEYEVDNLEGDDLHFVGHGGFIATQP